MPAWMHSVDAAQVRWLQASLDLEARIWPDLFTRGVQAVLDDVYALPRERQGSLGEHLVLIGALMRERTEAMRIHARWANRLDVLEVHWARSVMGLEIARVTGSAASGTNPFVLAARLGPDEPVGATLDPRLRVDPLLLEGLDRLLWCSSDRPAHPALAVCDASRLLAVAPTHEAIEAFSLLPDPLLVPGDWQDQRRLTRACAFAHAAVDQLPIRSRPGSLSATLFSHR